MKYVGLQTQIWKNNRRTVLLLFLFPAILLAMVLAVIIALDTLTLFCGRDALYEELCRENPLEPGLLFRWAVVKQCFLDVLPYTIGVTVVWFIIAYFTNTSIIRAATGARPLERRENVRVYNIVENLCIAGDIYMPKINIIDDNSMNAFASGIDDKSYTITLTKGIIEKLDDAELSAVVAHELTHIRNRDTRLLVVCIVFVGIFSTIMSVSWKMIQHCGRSSGRSRSKSRGNGGGIILLLLIILLASTIAYFFSFLTRLAISRKREYVADAGGAELCGDPLALASALRKVSRDPGLFSVKRSDIAQLYIMDPADEDYSHLKGIIAKLNTAFSTHPSTAERIRLLEQF